MRVARRTVLVSTLASLAAPAILRLARADAPIALKLHHFMSSVSSGHDKFLSPWARKVEADSGGRIRIDIFPSMQLGGTPAQLFDQARDGTVDIVWTLPSLSPGRFPKIEMFELPFLPARRALVSSRALQDFAAANLKDEFREVRALSFSCSDRGVVHANQPVRTIQDLKDLKLHVQTRFAGEAMRALEAHPVPMPFGQLPLAITSHVVDGCVDPWHLVPTLRLNDLLRAHTEFTDLSLSSTSFVLAMNADAYDRLPRELKSAIDNNSGQAAAGMAGTMWDLQAAAVADMVAERGDTIVTLLPEAVVHWRKATEPVVELWLKEMKEQKVDGGKLLASARALLAKYASLPEPQPTQNPPPQQQEVGAEPPRPEAKVEPTKPDTIAPPKPPTAPAPKQTTAAAPTTAAPPAKPVPPSAPAAKPTPPAAPQTATHTAPQAPKPVPPVAKPVPPAPSPAVATAPPTPSPAPPPTPAPPPLTPPTVAAAPPAPAPPIPKPVPKALDIPL
jgi:TRAP-type C4-dicarboxylate transport system substrate-binding protein